MRFVLGGIALVWSAQPSASQYADSRPEPRGIPEQILNFYAPFMIPKLFQDVSRLRSFIRSDEFATARATHGDLFAVDLIFSESMNIAMDNCYEALLVASVATMDHRRVGIRLPPVGVIILLPLTSEFPDEFEERVTSLPRMLYPDSPSDRWGDRDKLQHFFGSAFIAFTFESRDVVDRIGEMVEIGEEGFIEDGKADERDIRANNHGRSFGIALLEDRTVTPSDFLQLVSAFGSIHSAPTGNKDDVLHWCGPDDNNADNTKEPR